MRPGAAPGSIEAVIAQGGKQAEVAHGSVVGTRIELDSTSIVPTQTAKAVQAVHRVLELDRDVLHVHVGMAAVGHPMCFHLEAHLRRV